MRYFYLIFILCTFSKSYSQGDKMHLNQLSPHPHLDSTAPRGFRLAGSEEKLYPFDSLLYFDNADSVKSFVKNKHADGPIDLTNINFGDSALILVEYSGVDCHSGFIVKLTDEMDLQRFMFDVKVMYGGCRAAGRRFLRWFVIPKLPEGYTITYHTHVEYEREYRDK